MGLTGVATFLPVFGSERIVYWREAAALPQPLHTLAYFVGKDIAWLPQVLIGPALFTMAYTSLTFPRDTFVDIYCEGPPSPLLLVLVLRPACARPRSYIFGRVLVRVGVWLPRRGALSAVSCSATWCHFNLRQQHVCR